MSLLTGQHAVGVFFNIEACGRTGHAEIFNLFPSRKWKSFTDSDK